MTKFTPANILVGFADALAAPEVAWSLQDAGFRVIAFTRRGRKPCLFPYAGIELLELTAPEEDATKTTNELRSAILQGRYQALMPLDDTAIWLCDRIATEIEVPVVGPTGKQAALALDKGAQILAAKVAGLLTPNTLVLDDATSIVGQDQFPIVIKSAMATIYDGYRLRRPSGTICANKTELNDSIRHFKGNGPLLVQPFISGVGEGLFGLAGANGVYAWSAHRRVRMMNPHGSGSSACQSVKVDKNLVGPATLFLQQCQWRGIFMLEFLRDERGNAWFMELNGRSWGSMALARRMGLEYPAWALSQVISINFVPPNPPPMRPIVCRHLGRELVHLLMVLRGPKSQAITNWPSRRTTLRALGQIGPTDCWYNLRKGKALFFVADAIQTVARQLMHKRNSQ